MEEGIKASDLLLEDRDAQVNAIGWMLKWSRYEDAEERAAKVLKDHPDDVEALLLQGSAAARLNRSAKRICGSRTRRGGAEKPRTPHAWACASA
jgi:hypothetical protein